MERWRVNQGWLLELIPRDPKPSIEGLVLVGWVVWLEWPRFALNEGWTATGQTAVYRLDENSELAVREFDRSVWEVGRTLSRDAWNQFQESERLRGTN